MPPWHTNTLTHRNNLAFKQGQLSSLVAITADYHLGRSIALGILSDNPSEAGCLWMFQACQFHVVLLAELRHICSPER